MGTYAWRPCNPTAQVKITGDLLIAIRNLFYREQTDFQTLSACNTLNLKRGGHEEEKICPLSK